MEQKIRKWDNYIILESIELIDSKDNKLCLQIKKNDYNQCRIDFTLNGIELCPSNFNGAKSARMVWNMLTDKINR